MSIKTESISTGQGIECEDCCSFASMRVVTPKETFHLCGRHYNDRRDDFDVSTPAKETTSLG
ncbi:hypothetical protein D3C86_1841490 [compost metagenome]|jgi:hypothetical protein